VVDKRNSDAGGGSLRARGSSAPMPRWVKVSGVVALILALLFVAAHLTGLVPMGGHG
jgi:hypothetical protein